MIGRSDHSPQKQQKPSYFQSKSPIQIRAQEIMSPNVGPKFTRSIIQMSTQPSQNSISGIHKQRVSSVRERKSLRQRINQRLSSNKQNTKTQNDIGLQKSGGQVQGQSLIHKMLFARENQTLDSKMIKNNHKSRICRKRGRGQFQLRQSIHLELHEKRRSTLKHELQLKQMQECTFIPKLCPYNPR